MSSSLSSHELPSLLCEKIPAVTAFDRLRHQQEPRSCLKRQQLQSSNRMPEASYEVRLSYREVDRPRLMQAMAVDADGTPAVGVPLRLLVDDYGSLEDESPVQLRDVVTGV